MSSKQQLCQPHLFLPDPIWHGNRFLPVGSAFSPRPAHSRSSVTLPELMNLSFLTLELTKCRRAPCRNPAVPFPRRCPHLHLQMNRQGCKGGERKFRQRSCSFPVNYTLPTPFTPARSSLSDRNQTHLPVLKYRRGKLHPWS